MAKKAIKSRILDRSLPWRVYRCPGCDLTKKLPAGKHWHTCGNYEWNMHDVALSDTIDAAMATAMAHAQALMQRRGG